MDLPIDLGSLDLGALEAVGQRNRPDPSALYDTLILGGGPAAMTAAVYCARKMMKCAVVTEEFGGQVGETTEIENYMGFMMIGGKELAQKFVEHMDKFEVPAAQRERIAEVSRDGAAFAVRTESGAVYRGRTVICALGKRYKHLEIPGEKELAGKGVSYCEICDAPFFRKKRVVVAGGGNSAFTAALDLMKIATTVTVVNHSSGWKADRILLDRVRLNANVTLVENHSFVRIEGERRVTGVKVRDNATGAERRIETDGVFVEIGGMPNSEPVAKLVRLNQFKEIVIDCHCRTDVPGFFAAGDVTTVPYKQIVVSAGEGSKAALAAYDFLAASGTL
jgi:alkyl hydroperoxide reductase subunit F